MKNWLISIFVLSSLGLYGQNEFKIGFYNLPTDCVQDSGRCYTVAYLNGKPTSPISELANNGANIIGTYFNLWHSVNRMNDLINNCNSNNCQFFFSAFPSVAYLPKFTNIDGFKGYTGIGSVEYKNPLPIPDNFSAAGKQMVLLDAAVVFEKVVAQHDNIWGIRTIDEPNFNHLKWTKNKYSAKAPYCTETPPETVDTFFQVFDKLQLEYKTDLQIGLLLAHHGKSITAVSDDLENNTTGCPFINKVGEENELQNDIYDEDLKKWVEKDYNPQEYLGLVKGFGNRFLFEGSYTLPINTYANRDYDRVNSSQNHFLGFLKSIDIMKTYSQSVHKVIDLGNSYEYLPKSATLDYNDYPGLFKRYHSTKIENGNWLWFQAYASIIHGVNGVWFYDLGWCEELDGEKLFSRKVFDSEHFPQLYNRFTKNLTKELAYINNKGLLDNESIIYSKLENDDKLQLFSYDESSINTNIKEFKAPEYALRYTLRANDSTAILIIANPSPVSLRNIEIDLSNIENDIISNANFYKLLFTENNNIESNSYKTNRDFSLNNEPLFFLLNDPCLDNPPKKFTLNFSAFDVHIIEFDAKKVLKEAIDIFPNPTRSDVTFHSVQKFKTVESITFYTINGQEIETLIPAQTEKFSCNFQNIQAPIVAVIRYKNSCIERHKIVLL